jgi:membrane-bound metal-dependent hydrolase YbcI (DUF457 family)
MYAAGHLALGYLVGSATSKLLKRSVYLPLLLLIAVLPDLDYLLPEIGRRSITHSLIVQGAIALPFLLTYRRRAVPYLLAIWSHSIIDLFNVAGVQLVWPLSTYNHPIIPYPIVRQVDPYMGWSEVLLAGLAFVLMITTRVVPRMATRNPMTLLLTGPVTALLFSLGAFTLSLTLRVAQLAFLILLSWSLLHYLHRVGREPAGT